jgi:hypothetical protein
MAKRSKSSATGKAQKRKLARDMTPGEFMELAFMRSRAWNQPSAEPLQKRSIDPVLGPLRWDGSFWAGSAKAPALGTKVALRVAADLDDPEEPTEHQRAAYAAVAPRVATLRPQVEKLIVSHYNAVKENYRDGVLMTPARIARQVPDLKKPADIWRLLSKPAIHVPYAKRKGPKLVMIDFDCTWDDEHGVRVVIRDGRATRVTTQDDEHA